MRRGILLAGLVTWGACLFACAGGGQPGADEKPPHREEIDPRFDKVDRVRVTADDGEAMVAVDAEAFQAMLAEAPRPTSDHRLVRDGRVRAVPNGTLATVVFPPRGASARMSIRLEEGDWAGREVLVASSDVGPLGQH